MPKQVEGHAIGNYDPGQPRGIVQMPVEVFSVAPEYIRAITMQPPKGLDEGGS
jgi:hypothetical protein